MGNVLGNSAQRITTTTTTGDAGPATPASLTAIGRYVIEGVLGSGGMAVVYLARDPALGRAVALKMIPAVDGAPGASRLLREGQALARVSHPNVIQVFEVGRDEGHVYVAMERVDGVTLEDWLRTPRTRREIIEVFAAAARGLAAAHAAGIVHRDFKPANVMVGRDGRVRVVDFGLACAGDEDRANGSVGTPAFMSPEQWRGEDVTAASDQFAFCVALSMALTGEHPFEATSRDALRAAVLQGELRPARLPRRLVRVLRRGLAVAPSERYPSLDALVAALTKRSRWPVLAAVAGVLVTAAVAWTVLGDREPTAVTTIYSAPQRLTSRGDLVRAAATPDGRRIAFITRESLVVQDAAPDAVQRVLLRGRFASHVLAWSPDAREIAVAGTIDGARGEPGLLLVDASSGAHRRVAGNLGTIALIGDGELAAARFADDHIAFYALADARTPVRTCALPRPFTGVRALRYDAPSRRLYVQLDRGDRESVIVRLDRSCTDVSVVAGPLAAFSFFVEPGGAELLVRLMGVHHLAAIRTDSGASTATHVIQSREYEPLAMLGDDGIVHLDRTTRWQLFAVEPDGTTSEVAGGAAQSRFAITRDGDLVAQVDELYMRGLLRIGPLAELGNQLPVVAENVVRVAWSPDETRLAVLAQVDRGYAVSVWDRATRTMSAARRLDVPYDVEFTWLDDHRLVYPMPHARIGFRWFDVDTGAEGKIEVGGGTATLAPARAHHARRLAFLTETPSELRVWILDEHDTARVVAVIGVDSPRWSRWFGLAWSADDRELVVFDTQSGDLWSVQVESGDTRRLAVNVAARSGGVTRVSAVFPRDRLLIETVTATADVYASRPIGAPRDE